MSSVRDRLEREQRHRQDKALPERSRSSLVVPAGPTPSTRNRAEAAEFEATPERLKPPDKHRAGGMTANASFNTRVRDRITEQRDQADVAITQPTTSDLIEYYAAQHKAEQKQLAEAQAARDREMQERVRNNEERGRQNLKLFNWRLALSQAIPAATPAEVTKIIGIAENRFPNAEPTKLVALLYTLRGATDGERPEWADAIGGLR